MKNHLQKLSVLFVLLFATMFSSCEQELYEEPLKQKKRPNITVEMKQVRKNSEVFSKLKNKFTSKLITADNARGTEMLLTLEGDFGEVKLNNVLEIVNDNEKAYSFEIEETVKKPNEFLNLVIDKNNVVWLYKMEKLLQQYKDFPINSERLVRYKLNNDLTLQNSRPCDTITFPPFQPDPVYNPGSGGGVQTPIENPIPISGTPNPGAGNWQGGQPIGGGFFPPQNVPGIGGGGGAGLSDLTAAIAQGLTDAWNWLTSLFPSGTRPDSSEPCNCSPRQSNVVIIDLPDNPCEPGGYIVIIPQSVVIDKINLLDALLGGNQLGYENEMYFYNNVGQHLDYFLHLAQNPPAGYATLTILPSLITHLRKTGDFEFVQELNDLATLEPNQADVQNLINLSILVKQSGNTFFTDEFANSLDPYIDLNLGNPPPGFNISHLPIKIFLNYRKIKQLNPEWTEAKCIWQAMTGIVHLSLDVFGLIPVLGEIADLTNGLIYTIEGDNLNAAFSFGNAVPIAGWVSVSAKYAIKIVDASQTASTIATKVKLVWKVVGNTIDWGSDAYCRKQLRKVLNITNSAIHGHHIMPLAFKNNPLVQKAAKSGSAFHMNEELNGFALASSNHLTGHNLYNQKIETILTYLNTTYPNMSPNTAYNHIESLNNQIKNLLTNNPTLNLGQISNLIIYP